MTQLSEEWNLAAEFTIFLELFNCNFNVHDEPRYLVELVRTRPVRIRSNFSELFRQSGPKLQSGAGKSGPKSVRTGPLRIFSVSSGHGINKRKLWKLEDFVVYEDH